VWRCRRKNLGSEKLNGTFPRPQTAPAREGTKSGTLGFLARSRSRPGGSNWPASFRPGHKHDFSEGAPILQGGGQRFISTSEAVSRRKVRACASRVGPAKPAGDSPPAPPPQQTDVSVPASFRPRFKKSFRKMDLSRRKRNRGRTDGRPFGSPKLGALWRVVDYRVKTTRSPGTVVMARKMGHGRLLAAQWKGTGPQDDAGVRAGLSCPQQAAGLFAPRAIEQARNGALILSSHRARTGHGGKFGPRLLRPAPGAKP